MSARYFLSGAVLGFTAGLLLAPESGARTRQELRADYFAMKDKVLEGLSQIKEISAETYGSVVNSVVNGYKEARLITNREAAQIKKELDSGYSRIKSVLEGSGRARGAA